MRDNSGFTLIELMLVIIVLGILAGIAIPRIASLQDKAADVAIANVAGSIRTAMEIYYQENESYPESDLITSWNDLDDILTYLELGESSEYNIGSEHQGITPENRFSYELKEDGTYELKLASNTTGIIHTVTPTAYQ